MKGKSEDGHTKTRHDTTRHDTRETKRENGGGVQTALETTKAKVTHKREKGKVSTKEGKKPTNPSFETVLPVLRKSDERDMEPVP
jgi:hypothetical protein